MQHYHVYFYILKFLILLLVALMSLKIIPVNGKLFTLIDTIFKISVGLFIIIFFSRGNCVSLDKHDRIIIILSGFILIMLIDYIKVINILFNINNDKKSDLIS
jgi:hypothetical protein